MSKIMTWIRQQRVSLINQKFNLKCFADFSIDLSSSEEKLASLTRDIQAKLLYEE